MLQFLKRDMQGLILTTTFPDMLKQNYDFGDAEVIWISDVPGEKNVINPRRLDFEITKSINKFFKESESPILLLDCLENLILENSLEKVQKFLKKLGDNASMNQATLLVPMNKESFSSEEVTRLGREFDSSLDLDELIRKKEEEAKAKEAKDEEEAGGAGAQADTGGGAYPVGRPAERPLYVPSVAAEPRRGGRPTARQLRTERTKRAYFSKIHTYLIASEFLVLALVIFSIVWGATQNDEKFSLEFNIYLVLAFLIGLQVQGYVFNVFQLKASSTPERMALGIDHYRNSAIAPLILVLAIIFILLFPATNSFFQEGIIDEIPKRFGSVDGFSGDFFINVVLILVGTIVASVVWVVMIQSHKTKKVVPLIQTD